MPSMPAMPSIPGLRKTQTTEEAAEAAPEAAVEAQPSHTEKDDDDRSRWVCQFNVYLVLIGVQFFSVTRKMKKYEKFARH